MTEPRDQSAAELHFSATDLLVQSQAAEHEPAMLLVAQAQVLATLAVAERIAEMIDEARERAGL